jgi:hypothetical protein
VSTSFLLRGLGAGIGIAAVGGIITSFVYIFLFNTGLGLSIVNVVTAGAVAGVGLLVGEGISLAVNRKRGRRLKLVAGFSMFTAITVITVSSGATFNPLILLASGLSFYIAVSKF